MTEKVADTFLTEKVFDTHVMVPVEKKVSDTLSKKCQTLLNKYPLLTEQVPDLFLFIFI